jgi:transcriptional regulator with XRE-family HTH domain
MGYSQKDAAEALGLKRRVLQYYEKGERDGERVSIPKTVRLACYALRSGITDYHGPDQKQETVSSGEDIAQDQEKKKPQ